MSKDFESTSSRECATIGPSITIKGEISGADDLVIEGHVEGTISLKENTVTVGKGASVKANIYANVVHVEGEVQGDLFGREQIVVHKSGCVRGNIAAPRLTLEDGARLKGSIDTEPVSAEATSSFGLEKIRTSSDETSARAKATAPMTEVRRPSLNGVRDTTTTTN